MKRWLVLMVLLAGSSGCAMMDEWAYDDGPWVYDSSSTAAAQPACGVVPAGGFSRSQTQEPELIQAK